jgi:tetratricopeptide (TPR) repeat protein
MQEGLRIRQHVLPPGHPDIAQSFYNLGLLYQAQGRHADVQPLLRDALTMREHALPERHRDIARSLDSLAPYEISLGKLSEAEGHLDASKNPWC